MVTPVYEWVPTTIVAATFLMGLVSESLEAGRIQRWASRVRRH
ncbi:MAG: hypothetical protein R3185_03735 [Candidatus Thermoplasmatota archaeon]|nr:hypothetical protein [Candidatus Thermoplasmatota archaeon]